MTNLHIVNLHHHGITVTQLAEFLNRIDGEFVPPLSQKVELNKYAEKIFKAATLLGLVDTTTGRIEGFLNFYCNDMVNKASYIPIAWINKDYRGQGYGKALFKRCFRHLREIRIAEVEIKTWATNSALAFYKKLGFVETSRVMDRPNRETSVHLKYRFKCIESVPFQPTHVDRSEILSELLGIRLSIKRDDLFPQTGGGNKSRMQCYIANAASGQGCNAIVTAGGVHSNHVRATALACAMRGWKSILFIHVDQSKDVHNSGTLRLARLAGAEVRFVEHADVAARMEEAMVELRSSGYTPCSVWGGGYCLEGAYAYYDAIRELSAQLNPSEQPGFIVTASAMGTSQAGMIAGCDDWFPRAQVIGISIARNRERGKKAVYDRLKELKEFLGHEPPEFDSIVFDDTWTGGGYEQVFPELTESINWAARSEGLMLDPTYTGKAFLGLVEYVKRGYIPKGSNVVFWHTGGLMNLLASGSV